MNKYFTKMTIALVLPVLFLTFDAQISHGQGTAFTYQGELQNDGAPASGTYNLQFSLYTNSTSGPVVAGPVVTNGVIVSNGLFTVTMDFGGSAWNGKINWLEIDVETNGGGSFTTLSPRQQLTPTPYAIFANGASNLVGTLPVGQLSGMVGNGQLANNSVTVNAGTGLNGGGTVALGGSTTLNNAGVTSLAGSQGVTVSAASGSVTLGSTATSVNTAGAIVSRDGSRNFSAGSITLSGNLILPSSPATISAGTSQLLHSDTVSNTFVGLNSGVSTTGPQNTAIGAQALFSNTLGSSNVASGAFALYNNVSGSNNVADGYAALYNNNAPGNTAVGYEALYANANGQFNVGVGYQALQLNTNGTHNTAVGYLALCDATNSIGNTAVGVETLPFVTIGTDNTAVGVNASINDNSGSYNTSVGAQALDQNGTGSNNIALGYLAGFNINGGSSNIDIGNVGLGADNNIIRIGTTQTSTFLVGTVFANGVALTSDRSAKENFATVNPQVVLAKVASMPVTEWNYKSDKTAEHIGPMAQDFQAAFGLNGQDDKHISVVDEGGVALAAIQGLNQKVDELKKELERREAANAELQRQNDLLAGRLSQLETAVNRLSAQK